MNAGRFAGIEAAAGSRIERVAHAIHHPPRSFYVTRASAAVGCAVIVEVALERPGRSAQHRWIDAALDALGQAPPHGLVSAHLHPSVDGTSIVNYALWTSARAHRVSMTGVTDDPAGGESERWHRVPDAPGVTGSRVTRFRHHRTARART